MLDQSSKETPFLSVVMPVYNEVTTFREALDNLILQLNLIHNLNYELIVVESNSTDGTRELVESLALNSTFVPVYQRSPKGKGNAVRNALSTACGDWVMIFDADLEYDPRDIPALLLLAKSNSFDFIIGSRHSNDFSIRKMPQHKTKAFLMNLAHMFFTRLINLSIRKDLKDPFSMYKIFRRSLFSQVRLTSDRFDLDWELIIVGSRLGARFCEIPIRYQSRSFAEGKKILFFRDPITWLTAWLKFSFLPLKTTYIEL